MAQPGSGFRYTALAAAGVILLWSAAVGAWHWTLAGGLLLIAFVAEFYQPSRRPVFCPACRRIRSAEAGEDSPRCPHCGRESSSLLDWLRGVLFLAAVGAFVYAWVGG